MNLILLIVILLLIFGGGGGWYAHQSWGNPLYTGGGILVPTLVVLLIFWLLTGLRY